MPSTSLLPYLTPALLVCSNLFMTLAWYGHLRFKEQPIVLVVLVSWGIALFEYCFAVPANRYGNAVYSMAQLKTMQEVITLTVFALVSTFVLGEPFHWRYLAGFALIAAGAAMIFHGRA